MQANMPDRDEIDLRGAVCYQPEQPGCLLLRGPDRIAFLQRQTTNDVRLLQPGRVVLTVLTTPAARILDVFTLLEQPLDPGDEPGIFILPLPGLAAQTLRYLKSRIFFMDHVTIEDLSAQYTYLDLFGAGAPQVMGELELSVSPAAGETATFTLNAHRLICLGLDACIGIGWRLFCPMTAFQDLCARLESLGVRVWQSSTYERLRIASGLPAAGSELVEDFTPLEAGLAAAVSQTKGCFTGQEVLARQINYEKVTQSLCGLELAGPQAAGQPLFKDGQPAGRLTSVVESGSLGWIALGIIKRPHNQAGTVLTTSAAAQTSRLVVVELPFTHA